MLKHENKSACVLPEWLTIVLVPLTFQCDTDDGISSDSESPTSIHSLIRQMQEKERRILQLEAEVAKVCIVIL